MRRNFMIAAVCLLLPVTTISAQQSGDEAEVRQAVTRLFDAMRARDTAALTRLLDSAGRLVTTFSEGGVPDMDVTSVRQFIDLTARVAPGKLLDERIETPEIRIEDNLATVWVKYRFYVDTTFSHCGIDAMQLAKTTNGWQIIALADTRRQGERCGG
jgi:hypothetical protein